MRIPAVGRQSGVVAAYVAIATRRAGRILTSTAVPAPCSGSIRLPLLTPLAPDEQEYAAGNERRYGDAYA